ncbi:MAG: CinA family protein [Zetaproteobacteria bacterium]|nr:CinA family protein [Zetaproteobacteria bacterium]
MRSIEQQCIDTLASAAITLRCAESCTGGGIMARIASVAGASQVLDRGWVVYSNQAKHEMLGVPLPLIESKGAVSEEVVRALVEGMCTDHHEKIICLSISGIAGPEGGSIDKPVGTIWMATTLAEKIETRCLNLKGDRQKIQQEAIDHALQWIIDRVASIR